MDRRWTLLAAAPAMTAAIVAASLAAGAATAGKPTPASYLLCGTFTPAADAFAGNSNTDHPSGASSTGTTYNLGDTNGNCEALNNASSQGAYTWTITHSMVHVGKPSQQNESGVEHGQYTLAVDHSRQGGFQGHITDFDLSTADNTGDACASRLIYYASGQQRSTADTGAGCPPTSGGNFNTHGGAATGDHFRGNYGTVVYQWGDSNSNSPCKKNSGTYCFEGILVGQTN